MSRNLVNSISFFSPIIVSSSVLLFSIFSGTLVKGLFYIFWLLVITFLRITVLMTVYSSGEPIVAKPSICVNSELLPYDGSTYSMFILGFTAMYFIVPMLYIGSLNFNVALFFVVYLIFDLFIKLSNGCVNNIFRLIGDMVSGLALGGAVTSIVLSTPIKSYLFINEVNKNNEVCSKPSKQTFKCNVYKNGELISSSIR